MRKGQQKVIEDILMVGRATVSSINCKQFPKALVLFASLAIKDNYRVSLDKVEKDLEL